MPTIERKTRHPYIYMNPKILDGQPVIKNTRIKVLDIAIRYEFIGLSVDDIIDEYPHLRLEQVHDALSYYYENKDILNNKLREEQSFLTHVRGKYPSKVKAKLKWE